MFNNHGFIKVAAAIPELRVADCDYNAEKIAELILTAEKEGVEIICFPELSITSASCGDLFLNNNLIESAETALKKLLIATMPYEITGIVGLPVRMGSRLYNAVVVFKAGKVNAVIPQSHISTKNARWFSRDSDLVEQKIEIAGYTSRFATQFIFQGNDYRFAVLPGNDFFTPLSEAASLAIAGVDILFNPAARAEIAGQHAPLLQQILAQSRSLEIGVIYCSAGAGESSTDSTHTGNAFIAEQGKLLKESERFTFNPQLIISEIDTQRTQAGKLNNDFFRQTKPKEFPKQKVDYSPKSTFKLTRFITPHPFIPTAEERDQRYEEIFAIQSTALAKRWQHTGLKNLVLGISGGLDSTLALLVSVKTADRLGFDRKQILGFTMPGFGTTGRTYNNAVKLMEALGITTREISIKEASLLHFKDIGHDPQQHDVTYENVQARERTQILMDLANKENGLVVGTGNLSEVALGWSTYNGDHISMYAVNVGVPKTLVQQLTAWAAERMDGLAAEILCDIVATPISPELLPFDEKGEIKQKTENVVGPYELHDFFLYNFVKYNFSPEKLLFIAKQAFDGKYNENELEKWLATFLRRFVQQQFKRSCSPDGPQVTEISLSPRGGWQMPSDAINFFNLK